MPLRPGDPEVHVTVHLVCELALDELRDERFDLLDVLRRLRDVVGHAESEVARVLEVPRSRARREVGARTRRRVVDLVVDVGDVVNESRVVAAETQPVAEPHPDDERARVADVRTRCTPSVRRSTCGSAPAPRAGPRRSGTGCYRAASSLRSVSSRSSAATTAPSSGPLSRPVSASRSVFRSPPTAFSSRTSDFAWRRPPGRLYPPAAPGTAPASAALPRLVTQCYLA